MTKDAMTSSTSSTLIPYARSKVMSHPSIADDIGTDVKTGQHLLTVMWNKSKSCKGIADTPAVRTVTPNFEFWETHVQLTVRTTNNQKT